MDALGLDWVAWETLLLDLTGATMSVADRLMLDPPIFMHGGIRNRRNDAQSRQSRWKVHRVSTRSRGTQMYERVGAGESRDIVRRCG